MSDETWKFNVISGIHNHALTDKLVSRPIVCLFVPEERELVSDTTLNMVSPKNILAYLKQKKTFKCFKYQANIQRACSRPQGGNRTKI